MFKNLFEKICIATYHRNVWIRRFWIWVCQFI